MSFYYCRNIKKEESKIAVEIAPNNISPISYEWGSVSDIETLTRLVYYNEIQLRSTAKRSAIGKRITRAIGRVISDNPAWQDNTSDWKEKGEKELKEILDVL